MTRYYIDNKDIFKLENNILYFKSNIQDTWIRTFAEGTYNLKGIQRRYIRTWLKRITEQEAFCRLLI